MTVMFDIAWDDLEVDSSYTFWRGGSGQGGSLVLIDDTTAVTIVGDYTYTHHRAEVTRITYDGYLDATECIEYGEAGENCEGNVDYGGPPRGSGPARCDKHMTERWERYDNSIERYADSDCVPSWFDPTIAGERWEDD